MSKPIQGHQSGLPTSSIEGKGKKEIETSSNQMQSTAGNITQLSNRPSFGAGGNHIISTGKLPNPDIATLAQKVANELL